MRYPIILKPSDDKTSWGVIVPDFPGCFSAGDNFDEAMENVIEAMTLWVEDWLETGNKIPPSSSLEKLQKIKIIKKAILSGVLQILMSLSLMIKLSV